jgi:hypothetical protein
MSTDEKELPTKEVEAGADEEAVVDTTAQKGTKDKSDWSVDRRTSIKETMSTKKADQKFDLTEDVYALVFVCPVASKCFFVAMLIVALKLTIYGILASGIDIGTRVTTDRIPTTVVKCFLIPVIVAMQEDLMGSYFFFANGIYCDSTLKVSKHATKNKLFFSYVLRTIDGFLGLYVNYATMLITPDTLGVFLNFAALQFLYSIDDVFYDLIEKGFFGDTMEHWATLCNDMYLARRHGGDHNHKFLCFRISHLDTIFTFMTGGLCYLGWILVTIGEYSDTAAEALYGSAATTGTSE